MSCDNILYELFIYSEWRPDSDLIQKDNSAYTKESVIRFFSLFKPELTLKDYLSNFIDQLQPWQICLGNNGKVAAILQDTVLEIRSKRGNFSNAVARVAVPRDPNPQWRKMAWSPDCSLLAVAHSNGKVSLYDLSAINLFDIQPDCSQPTELQCTDTTHAIASIIFLTNRIIEQKWSCELLLVDYKGNLRSFFVSPTDGFKFNHKFVFDGGASTVTYHNRHNMLFVSGLPAALKEEASNSLICGLKGWRLLNDPPFYKLSVSIDKEQPVSFVSWIFNYLFNWKKNKQSVIIKAVISHNGSLLACLHANGGISFWQLPIIKMTKLWHLLDQPDYNMLNPLALTSNRQKVWPDLDKDMSEYMPIDINWWTDEIVIISRINGSVSICNINDLNSMLGDKPVFLQGHPQISSAFDNGFLSLECEASLILANKLRRKSESDVDPTNDNKEMDEKENNDEIDKITFGSWTSDTIRAILYIITDMERFQPRPKKLHLLSRIYRLLCLKSTTPDDLYLRKIENADYDEALTLARKYELDCDFVYQQQWRTTKVSSESIMEYLNKVSKKIWVIQQCCDRVPENLSAAKELLEFGLKLTNKEIYKGLETDVDRKTFAENYLWNKITPEELTSQTSEILRYRYTMLFYLDRLDIYKAIIKSECSVYSAEEYNRLRGNTICRSAIEFAKEGRVEALTCLWPHLCDITLQLIVLQNLPETLDPITYKQLLPSQNSVDINDKQRKFNRDKDWCENDIFRSIWSSVEIDELEIDECINNEESLLPSSNLTEWYSARAHQIEEKCGLSSISLMLIGFAIEKNVSGLESLYSLLTTLDILLYDVDIEPMSLKQLEDCSQTEIANLLMTRTTEETIIDDMKILLFPYLARCEKLSSVPSLKETLLREYMSNLSKTDLGLALRVFQDAQNLGISVQQCLTMAEDCFVSQENNDNLSSCFDILEALPESSDDSITPSNLIKNVDEMERYLNACQLMLNYGLHVTYFELKNMIGNEKEMRDLLIKTAHSTKTLKTSGSDWNELLMDILQLHSLIFCVEDKEICHEILASSMISSSNKLSIMSAEQILTCQNRNHTNSHIENRSSNSIKNKIPYRINVSYKISYEKSIILVLKSAREYFDSASNLKDQSLDFAWACLQLINEDNSEIQYEKNLISALKIVSDFNISILPVQVRTCPFIDLIKDCLELDENSYKHIDKMLQLGKLLSTNDDEKKREVTIVSLCAMKSIDREDYEEARILGKRLINLSEGPSAANAVKAAQKLGTDTLLTDLPLRHELLDLALLHCEAQHIESLLQTRSLVESEILQSEINNILSITKNVNTRNVNLQDSMESTEDDYLDALTSPIVENKVITTAVEKFIQKPLTVLGDKKTWRNALSFNWSNDSNKFIKNDSQIKNEGKLACHTFYAHLHKKCYVSQCATQYNDFSAPDICDPQLVMLHSLIRNNLLQDCIKYGNSDTVNVETLIQCAEYTLAEDTAYCLSHLLSVCYTSEFFKQVKSIQLDIKTIHTILYFYCLMNYIGQYDLPDDAFIQSPVKLISEMIKYAQNLRADHQNEVITGLLYCKEIMDQLIEAKTLIKNGCNIDMELFTKDAVYRKNIIINLSRTENKDMFDLAMNLSQKYDLRQQDVVFNYISHIIMNHESIGFANCNNIVSDENLINKLTENNDSLLQRLHEEIWSVLDGNNHNVLILYFTLVSNIDGRYLLNGINAKEHLKLVKKCKSACSLLNYKYILSNPTQDDFSNYIMKLLSKDNVGVVTKFLRNLPTSFNFNFNSSRFYRTWLLHFFFNIPENVQSNKKWMQQHRECLSFFSKLNQDDMLSYTKEILFGKLAVEKLPPSTRIQIAFQTADYCQHEHSNNENINFKNKQLETRVSWEDVGIKISRWGKFLENFYSETIKAIMKNNPSIPIHIWKNIECSRGLWSEMLHSLTDLLLNNSFKFEELFQLLKCLDDELSVNDLLIFIIEKNDLNASVLSSITKRLMEMKRENIHISQDILDTMKSYSSSPLLSSKQRLDLMSIYKVESDNDGDELLEKISLELISSTWGDVLSDFKESNIINPSTRATILKTLIGSETNWEKLKVIVDLINMWPLCMEESKPDIPHVQLILKLINGNENVDENIPLLKLLMSKHSIPSEDIFWIIANDSKDNVIGKLWLCLFSSDTNIHNTCIPNIASEIKDLKIYDDLLSDQILEEILNKKLFSSVVKTKIYPKLVNYLFKIESTKSSSCQYTIDMAINDLLVKKFKSEAGALKMAVAGIPNSLKGFTETLLYHNL